MNELLLNFQINIFIIVFIPKLKLGGCRRLPVQVHGKDSKKVPSNCSGQATFHSQLSDGQGIRFHCLLTKSLQ